MTRMETRDQKFFKDGNGLKATIDVDITHEAEDGPSLRECRHAVLQLSEGYVVYDRWLSRIVNGVFMFWEDALGVALRYNEDPGSPQDMAPNGLALGLTYPPYGAKLAEMERENRQAMPGNSQ